MQLLVPVISPSHMSRHCTICTTHVALPLVTLVHLVRGRGMERERERGEIGGDGERKREGDNSNVYHDFKI